MASAEHPGSLRPFRNLRLWLTPGMGVKRHVFLAVLGALILVAGALGGVLWLAGTSREALSAPLEAVLVSGPWQAWGGWFSLIALLAGMALAVEAIGRLNRSLLSNWLREPQEAAVRLHRRLSLAKGPRIVALGGGSGLANLLRGLRTHTSNTTAVVAVSDDGGSSGRLRVAFDMPAPGDLSDCLAALSDNESEVSRLLEYRFSRGNELKGHTFGNLLITTLTEVEGDFAQAIRLLNSLLNICGAVYPVTTEPVSLQAVKRSGQMVRGESQLRVIPGAIASVSIEPEQAKATPEVLQAIDNADLIVLGPGSLFTSTIPPLLLPEVRAALSRALAPVVYVCNIMTEAGETDGFDVWAHVSALAEHLGRYPDTLVVNATPVDAGRLERYRAEGAEVVAWNPAPFESHGINVVRLELLGAGPHAQHDSERLARWIVDAARTLPFQDRVLEHV